MTKTAERVVFKPAEEFGPVLSGRFVAEELRLRVESVVKAGDTVVLDFEGVEAMSPSFADELFAKLPREAVEAGLIRFEHLDEDLLALARFVIEGREGSAKRGPPQHPVEM